MTNDNSPMTNPKHLRILGVDPGTLLTGFGVIEIVGRRTTMVECGVIRMRPTWSMPLRLREIHLKLLEVIDRTHPDMFAIESAFYAKNVQSTLKLGHARGVAILAAVLREIPTSEYAPREVKMAVTGNGGAAKEQVAFMVTQMLGMTEQPETLDATDALAIALCHASRLDAPASPVTSSARSRGKVRGGWERYIAENPDRIVR